jgi:hypothetical protein
MPGSTTGGRAGNGGATAPHTATTAPGVPYRATGRSARSKEECGKRTHAQDPRGWKGVLDGEGPFTSQRRDVCDFGERAANESPQAGQSPDLNSRDIGLDLCGSLRQVLPPELPSFCAKFRYRPRLRVSGRHQAHRRSLASPTPVVHHLGIRGARSGLPRVQAWADACRTTRNYPGGSRPRSE